MTTQLNLASLRKAALKLISAGRLLLSPKRFFWFLRTRYVAPFLPLDVLPSYEHKFLAKLVRCPSLFLDVGFNKGQFSSMVLLSFPNSKVLSFDPSPQSNDKYAPVLSSAFPCRFRFRNVAVGDRTCTAELKQAISFDNNSLLQPTAANVARFPRASIASTATLFVPCIRLQSLDDEVYGDDIFLKIDVQGYEMQVLRGLSPALCKKIQWIYVELTDLTFYDGQASADEIKSYIYSIGYSLVADFNIHKCRKSKKIEYCDSLFVRRETI